MPYISDSHSLMLSSIEPGDTINLILRFKTSPVEIEITEYPHDSGDELHISIKPETPMDWMGLTGAPESEQTFSVKFGDAIIWIKGKFYDKMKETIEKYETSWEKEIACTQTITEET